MPPKKYPPGHIFREGKRLYFVPLHGDEAEMETVLRWFNDPEVTNFLQFTSPVNRIREKEWYERLYADNTQVVVGIRLKRSHRYIGNCGLHAIDSLHRKAEAGIAIGEKDCWGKGYGTEAMELLLDYGFDTLNLHRIFLRVYDFNKRAMGSYKKIGFKQEGTYRDDIFKAGRYYDTHVLSVLEKEWRKRRKE